MSEPWSREKMLALATLHARLEEEQKLDELMDTLVAEPIYEFHPMRKTLSGGETLRRYYEQFFADFMQKIVGYELLEEWGNEGSVIQEYDITLEVGGRRETHRILGVLFAEGDRLGGERIYGSDLAISRMAGNLIDEMESM